MSGGGAGAVVRQGHLRKLKTMKRKYFVLRAETADSSPRLEYYESEKKFRTGAAPRRVVPLKTCFNITRRLDLKQRHVIALYTKEEQFCVVAEGEDELHAWLTDLLKQHHNEDTIEELLHPTQHVWQVNVQKKGLGSSKNIIGLYNLCLTDKTLSLVKIRANNNMIGEPMVTEGVEFSLRNIRRCGDSECFFYMEVGRQTATGAGELWMHTDDANIALSMHHTIYNAMCNYKNEKELAPAMRNRSSSATEDPRTSTLPARRSTYSDGRGRAGLTALDANPLTEQKESHRPITHHRTVSLPTGSTLFQGEPLRIVHERTRSAPLTGDELDHATFEKAPRHSSCRTVNGTDFAKKNQWCRRASTGARLSKLSPAHTKNTPTIRNRCDSMPSRTCPPIESERAQSRLPAVSSDGDTSRDETDATTEWHRTPRIPEEPDYCEMNPMDVMNMIIHKMSGPGSGCQSRTSSLAPDDERRAMSGSEDTVCSGTPSTDPRFSEYQLEPATAHILDEEERPPRAYSVGSRPSARPPDPRLRAYSVGARSRRPPSSPAPARSTSDLMEIDFTQSPRPAPAPVPAPPRPRPPRDEYVDMSPRSGYLEMKPDVSSVSNASPRAGYVEMRPSAAIQIVRARSPPGRLALSRSPPGAVATTPDGYVEMNYGRRAEPERRPAPPRDDAIFQLSLDSPLSPPAAPAPSPAPAAAAAPQAHTPEVQFDEDPLPHHPLTTVREISEEHARRSPSPPSPPSPPAPATSPPHYVTLARAPSRPIPAPAPRAAPAAAATDRQLSCNPTANKTWAGGEPAAPPPPPDVTSLNYASLQLEPRGVTSGTATRSYTQIDFARSEKLHTADAT